ncbi:MAG: hypothetical protein HYV76_02700 [Candidatus Vogelbacteria bacterium]|nr:hypothetical protein [Candidatus Vogelbacteria bacterium]
MALPEAPDSLENLEKKLYERSYIPNVVPRHTFTPPSDGVSNWNSPPITSHPPASGGETNWIWRLLIGAVIFFISTLVIGGFLLFRGGNIVSNSNIEVVVRGPTAVKSGEETTLQIAVTNRNRVPLESAALVLDYPDSTRLSGPGGAEPAPARVKIDLGPLDSGQTVTKLVNPVFYGEQNTSQSVGITIEYKVDGSNALFEKGHQYTLGINSSPVAVVVDVPSMVSPGENFAVKVEIISNSQSILKKIRVLGDFPSDFKIASSNPDPSGSDRSWDLGDLTPGEKRTITLQGSISGQSQEVKSLLFSVGTAKLGDNSALDIPYGDHFEAITLEPASLGLKISINESVGAVYNAIGGESLRYRLDWINNTNTPLRDVTLVAILSGNAFDQSSLNTNGGVYRSLDNTITWTKVTTDKLALVRPGESGSVNFNLKTLATASGPGANLSAPTIKVKVESTGLTSSGGGADIVRTVLEQTVKVATAVEFSAKALYSVGAFNNVGPMPPKVNTETTYTIKWSLLNTTNDLKNVAVTAVLPGQAVWRGQVSPGSEKVTFNEDMRTITWSVGTLARGTGVGGASREVSFQIGFTPSANQVGELVTLLEQSELTGTDSFTAKAVNLVRRALNTKLLFDPAFANDPGIVVK